MGGKGSGQKKSSLEPEPETLITGLIELRQAVANLNKHLAELRTDDMYWWGKLQKLIQEVSKFGVI